MKRLTLMFVALVVLFTGWPVLAGDPRPATVKVGWAKVVSTNPDGTARVSSATGSGTVVASGETQSFVLSNRHIVGEPLATYWVMPLGESSWSLAEVVAVDSSADLGLLRVRRKLPAAELATELPGPGARLRTWGYPGGLSVKPKSGEQIGYKPGATQEGGARVFLSSVVPEHGESGSGLFDDDGKLVGVQYGFARSIPGEGRSVGLEDVKRFVRAHLVDLGPAKRNDKLP